MLFFTRRNYLAIPKSVQVIGLLLLLAGCSSLQESPKYQLSEGMYKAKIGRAAPIEVFLDLAEDQLVLHPLIKSPEIRHFL